jgi:hypothetical protein
MAVSESINTPDPTENYRKTLLHVINASLSPDEQQRYHELCTIYGEENVFDTNALQTYFTVEGFLAPFVVVVRKSDNKKGTMEFCHSPRFYFGFTPA